MNISQEFAIWCNFNGTAPDFMLPQNLYLIIEGISRQGALIQISQELDGWMVSLTDRHGNWFHTQGFTWTKRKTLNEALVVMAIGRKA